MLKSGVIEGVKARVDVDKPIRAEVIPHLAPSEWMIHSSWPHQSSAQRPDFDSMLYLRSLAPVEHPITACVQYVAAKTAPGGR